MSSARTFTEGASASGQRRAAPPGEQNGDAQSWGTPAPEHPGYHWVWQPAGGYPCDGGVLCVEVIASEQGLQGVVPRESFAENVVIDAADASDGDAWYGARWMGPLVVPPAPQGHATG